VFSSIGAVSGRDDGNYPVENVLTMFAGGKFMDRDSWQGK
jgi:hypothetical protein